MWKLVIIKQLDELGEHGCKKVGYADGLMFIDRGQYLDILIELTQRIIRIVETWCTKNCKSANSKKTEVIVFSRLYEENKMHCRINEERLQLISGQKILELHSMKTFSGQYTLRRRVGDSQPPCF